MPATNAPCHNGIFFLWLPLCVTNCQSVPTQSASVAGNPLMSFRGKYNATADLTNLTCYTGVIPKKSKNNSICYFSFSDDITCCMYCASFYVDALNVFNSCFLHALKTHDVKVQQSDIPFAV